ncbi:MarR family winged helix-turn-helix transcriptional regulator [Glutamicibacter sp.]|jgi:Transcriptional regulators|uniref:MarR family winged helix-turn-helix transcriptional regulator n=1 Tax=Glutamicibacter sp. TaxID=1931995 RepID=UPI002B46AADC|nr:MarR family transcriptional regulator [Glutamicibacter sp.]HJX77189.1 MarR family transcriptional regulator [Glutamicibacter sp.]
MTSSPLDPILAEDLLDAIYPLFGMLNKVRSISAGKLGILSLAEEQGKITAAAMKDKVGVSQQAISLAAKELVEMGLLVRTKDPADLRRTWFALTDSGAQKLHAERQLARTELAEMINKNLTRKQQESIRHALEALTYISRGGHEAN